MALIKCKGCGQMVSSKAEKCPKCGYSVRLSMEQQEETKQSVEVHTTTLNTPKEEAVNDSPQPQQRNNKKGIIIAVIVVVIIGCGVLFAILQGRGQEKDSNQITQQTRDIPTIEASLQNVTTIQDAKQLIEGTVWEHTVNTDESELGYWVKVEFANGRYKTFYMNPSDDDWSNGGEGTYEIKEGKFANTGEKYIAVYWEGGGYLGWPTKYALVLNNFQITVQSALPDPDALFSYEPQPTSNGFMKLVDIFEVTQDTITEDKLPSDSVAVAVEDMPNNYSTEITKDGIANIRLGKSFNDYNTSYMKQEDIEKQCFDFSIVDIQEISEFEEVYYTMNMKLYKGQELLCTLFGGYFDKRPNTLQATVKSITVYSPQFKLPNGIHAGMSVKELINDYGATIQLNEGEGGENVESISLEIPNCQGFYFNVEKKTLLNRYGDEYFNEYDSQSGTYKENFWDNIKKEVAELSDLESIVIGNRN